jgi:hypothetical protein
VDGYHVSGTAPDASARATLRFMNKHTAPESLSDAGA